MTKTLASRAGQAAIFFALLIVMLILTWPLRLALQAADAEDMISADRTPGSVWSGQLIGANVLGLDIGDVELGASLLRIITGRPALHAETTGSGPFMLTAYLGGSGSIGDADGTIDLAAMLPSSEIGGTLTLTGLNVEFSDGSCRRASGDIAADILIAQAGAAGSRSFAGSVACEGEDAAATLQNGADRLRLTMAPDQTLTGTLMMGGTSIPLAP